MKNLRIIIDTNLIVSALILGGRIAKLRLAWQSDRTLPLASSTAISELIRVLSYPKFKLSQTQQEDLLSDYLPFCDVIVMPEQLPNIPECRDHYDKPFLFLALVGKADYLVTGDQDLLCLADTFACPIITINTFFRITDY